MSEPTEFTICCLVWAIASFVGTGILLWAMDKD